MTIHNNPQVVIPVRKLTTKEQEDLINAQKGWTHWSDFLGHDHFSDTDIDNRKDIERNEFFSRYDTLISDSQQPDKDYLLKTFKDHWIATYQNDYDYNPIQWKKITIN
jgi:hypothetical protein